MQTGGNLFMDMDFKSEVERSVLLTEVDRKGIRQLLQQQENQQVSLSVE